MALKIDDLVWAKFKNYRPWPGRIMRKTTNLDEGCMCVQFYGNDDYSEVVMSNIYPYLEKVDEFTANISKNYGSGFYTAINTIHEKYWNLVDLKRDSEDSGFPVSFEEELKIAIEDRKAALWNPRLLRRPLPEELVDDSNFEYDPYFGQDFTGDSDSGGNSRRSSRRRRTKRGCKKGSSTKQVQNGSKCLQKTGSETESTCQSTKASTSSQSSKASTSSQSTKVSTSNLISRASTSGQSNKASSSSQTSETSSQSSEAEVTCASSSDTQIGAKKLKSIQILRKSAKGTSCKNSKVSTSQVINTPQVTTRKRKSSENSSLPEQETPCKTSRASTSKVISSPGVTTRKRKSSETSSLSEQETSCKNNTASTSKVINAPNVTTRKHKTSETLSLPEKVDLNQEVKSSASKTSCKSAGSDKKNIASEITTSPFQDLCLPTSPVFDIPFPKESCLECKIKYGFIGLRSLSQSIIYPLLNNSHHVNVWSKDASKFNVLRKAGAVRTNTPAGIVTSSDVIFYTTRDPDISRNILLTQEGVFDGCARSQGLPKIFVELTNIDHVEPERSIRPLIKFQGGFYLQVKVIIPQINEKASPTFLCAGELKVFSAVAPCLLNVTRDIHYFGTEFFKEAPMNLTPNIVEELVLQSLQKTTSYLYDLGFHVPDFEKIVCHQNFEFGKIAAKLKESNEADRNKKIVFYQDM